MILKYEIFFEKKYIVEEIINACFIEENLGSMETAFISGKEQHFIYIEDNHGKIENLKKIDRILKKFNIQYKLKLREKLDNSYLTKYKESLKPLLIDNILIKPSWSEIKTIEIDPQTAFGTGHHETTQLSVKALLKTVDNVSTLLDVGTGSGILSMVANLLKIRYIYSFDNDKEAVFIAKKNFINNKFTDNHIFTGTFDALKKNLKFDIVIANIISSVLIKEKKFLKSYVAEQGILILSGILKEELKKFKEEFGFQEFFQINELYLNEWSCLIYKKRG